MRRKSPGAIKRTKTLLTRTMLLLPACDLLCLVSVSLVYKLELLLCHSQSATRLTRFRYSCQPQSCRNGSPRSLKATNSSSNLLDILLSECRSPCVSGHG